MDIDWITVTAQIVNFLVLIWLLQRFLYRPVIRAMDEREQRIASRLDDAARREREADAAAREHHHRRHELERRREDILSAAREAATGEQKRWLEEARREVAGIRESWQVDVRREREEFLRDLRRRSAEAFTIIARKGLRDLADRDLEEQISEVFIRRLRGLDGETRRLLTSGGGPVTVASAFEPDSALRGRLTRGIHEALGKDVEVEYRQDPALVCGVELRSRGRKAGWTLEQFLDDLGQHLDQAFDQAFNDTTPAGTGA